MEPLAIDKLGRKQAVDALASDEAALKAITDKPDDDWTADDLIAVERLRPRLPALKAQIEKFGSGAGEARKAVADSAAFRRTAVMPVPYPGATKANHDGSSADGSIDLTESEDDKFLARGPFKSLGHFGQAIRQGGGLSGHVRHGELGEWNNRVDKIHHAIKAMPDAVKAVTGMSELVDVDGAAFVPVELSKKVWQRTMEDDENLLALVDSTPVSGNGFRVTAYNDKDRTSGTLFGGAKAYWGAEGSQGTASKPGTRDINFRLNKITVLMYATEELLEDTVALDARLGMVAGKCFAYEINKAIIRGDGAGKPLGILSVANDTNSGPRLVVAAVAAQGAATIIGKNITSMFARRPPGSKKNLVWLYNVDCEPQFDQLNFTAGSTAAQWLYTTSLKDDGEMRLKGRRMIESEQCSALGTEGDLILWDPTSYGAIVKNTGIQQGVSMHLRFDYGEAAFRWTFRMDGRPFWDAVQTPANGATRAPIITLNSTRT